MFPLQKYSATDTADESFNLQPNRGILRSSFAGCHFLKLWLKWIKTLRWLLTVAWLFENGRFVKDALCCTSVDSLWPISPLFVGYWSNWSDGWCEEETPLTLSCLRVEDVFIAAQHQSDRMVVWRGSRPNILWSMASKLRSYTGRQTRMHLLQNMLISKPSCK